jgi:hypothetical protein
MNAEEILKEEPVTNTSHSPAQATYRARSSGQVEAGTTYEALSEDAVVAQAAYSSQARGKTPNSGSWAQSLMRIVG